VRSPGGSSLVGVGAHDAWIVRHAPSRRRPRSPTAHGSHAHHAPTDGMP